MPTTPSRTLLSGALALLALGTLLAPLGGSTRAAWSAGASVAVPPLTNDTVAITVTPQESAHPLPATATLTVDNESRRWATAVTPSPSVTPLSPDLGLAAQVEVSYRDCQSGAQLAGPLAVPPSSSGTLCAQVTTPPQMNGRNLFLQHAGQAVTVTHQITRELAAGSAWTSQASTTTTHSLDFPRPTHPGDELTLSGVCTSPVTLGDATLKWAWPDTASAGSTESPAVSHWQLQRLSNGQWENTGATIGASARSTTASRQVLIGLTEPTTFRVVGYSTADPSVPVVGTYQVTIRQLLNLGFPIGTRCAETKLLS